MIDPDRLMEVFEKHGETVTLSLLCDLMPVIGVRMRMERSKPSFVPAHKLPVWLSSVDVLEAINELAKQGVDKAACWDFTQAVYALIGQANAIAMEARQGRDGETRLDPKDDSAGRKASPKSHNRSTTNDHK